MRVKKTNLLGGWKTQMESPFKIFWSCVASLVTNITSTTWLAQLSPTRSLSFLSSAAANIPRQRSLKLCLSKSELKLSPMELTRIRCLLSSGNGPIQTAMRLRKIANCPAFLIPQLKRLLKQKTRTSMRIVTPRLNLSTWTASKRGYSLQIAKRWENTHASSK